MRRKTRRGLRRPTRVARSGSGWTRRTGRSRGGRRPQAACRRAASPRVGHLRRDFQALIDRGGSAKPIGERLLAASNRLFHAWHAFQRGEMSRADLASELVPVRMHFGGALSAALSCDDKKARALAKDLRRHWPALWTFVHTAGVEPTNNNAERTLRPAVLWRKGSFGTQSDAGSRFVERMLTVIHTAKRRGIPLLEWLERACASPTPDLVLRPCLAA